VSYLHLAIGQSITDCKDGGSFAVVDHQQIQNVKKVFLWKRDEDTRRTRETAPSLLTLDFFVPFVGHPVAHVQLMEALMSQTLHPV
jgi:hypothetical protein